MKITDILEIADRATLFKSDYKYTLNNFSSENKAIVRAIPEMEAKLRSIMDMLPEIKQTIQVYRNYRRDNDGNDTTGYYDDLLSKIEKWENE